MNCILYSLKNAAVTFKRRKLFALALVVSQIAAILSVYISVGFINNSLQNKREAQEKELFFNVDFYKNAGNAPQGALVTPMWKDVRESFFELYDFLGDDVKSIGIVGGGDSTQCSLYSGISEGRNTNGVGPKNSCYAGDTSKVGDTFTVEGVEFTVIEASSKRPTIVINLDDYPDTARVGWFNIELIDSVSLERIEEIKSRIITLFGQTESLSVPVPETLMEIQIDNMFIFASAAILLIAVVNISVYFRYIFKKREKQTAIMKICGAGSSDIFMISVFEMLGSFLASLCVSLIVFMAFLPWLQKHYRGFLLFEDRWYTAVFALVYLAVSASVSAALSMYYSSGTPSQSYAHAQKGGV